MDDVFSLIKCLTAAEWQSLRQYFTCFTTHDPTQLKYLRLAKMLREAEVCPSEKYCRLRLNKTKKDISFDVLKSRLKEKVLDFMLTDISCDKKQELDEADYNMIRMKKKSAQFQQLFYSKKRAQLMYSMLDEIINLAKEYEQYSVLVDHLRLKKGLVSWKKGKEEYEETAKEMQYYSECNILYNKAEHYYYELIMLHEYEGKLDKQKTLLFLEKARKEISDGNSRIKSPHVSYSLKFLEMEYYELTEDYLMSRSVCLELLTIVRNNKSVYRRQRVGVAYDNLSRYENFLGNYKQAIICAREAQKHFNLNSENYCIALEHEFYALFAQANYEEAAAVARKMLSSATQKELGEFRHSKYNYLLANALFKLRKFDMVLNLVTQKTELASDKAGWAIGVRVLKIMTLIEALKLDEASLEVTRLKDFLLYTGKTTPVSKRNTTILHLLQRAERKGFMFTVLNGNTEETLSHLASNDEDFRWEPFTPELIPFHQWLADKMKVKLKPAKLPEVKEKKALVRVGK